MFDQLMGKKTSNKDDDITKNAEDPAATRQWLSGVAAQIQSAGKSSGTLKPMYDRAAQYISGLTPEASVEELKNFIVNTALKDRKQLGWLQPEIQKVIVNALGKTAAVNDDFIVVNAKGESQKYYDVTGETGEQLVEKAHPGGGTKTELTHSKTDENLVETIVEQQKADIEVARSVPKGTYAELMNLYGILTKMGYKKHLSGLRTVIKSIATPDEVIDYTLNVLADKLDLMGFEKSADLVDGLLKKKVAYDPSYIDPGIAEYGGSMGYEVGRTDPEGATYPVAGGFEVEPAGGKGGEDRARRQRIRRWQRFYNKSIEGTDSGLEPLAMDGRKGPKTRAAMAMVRPYGSLKAFREELLMMQELPLVPIPTGGVQTYTPKTQEPSSVPAPPPPPPPPNPWLEASDKSLSKVAVDPTPGISEYGGSWDPGDAGMTAPEGASMPVQTGYEVKPAGGKGGTTPPKPDPKAARKARIKQWQKYYNNAVRGTKLPQLKPDGVKGPKTRAAMAKARQAGSLKALREWALRPVQKYVPKGQKPAKPTATPAPPAAPAAPAPAAPAPARPSPAQTGRGVTPKQMADPAKYNRMRQKLYGDYAKTHGPNYAKRLQNAYDSYVRKGMSPEEADAKARSAARTASVKKKVNILKTGGLYEWWKNYPDEMETVIDRLGDIDKIESDPTLQRWNGILTTFQQALADVPVAETDEEEAENAKKLVGDLNNAIKFLEKFQKTVNNMIVRKQIVEWGDDDEELIAAIQSAIGSYKQRIAELGGVGGEEEEKKEEKKPDEDKDKDKKKPKGKLQRGPKVLKFQQTFNQAIKGTPYERAGNTLKEDSIRGRNTIQAERLVQGYGGMAKFQEAMMAKKQQKAPPAPPPPPPPPTGANPETVAIDMLKKRFGRLPLNRAPELVNVVKQWGREEFGSARKYWSEPKATQEATNKLQIKINSLTSDDVKKYIKM
jgi:hypothetical protein